MTTVRPLPLPKALPRVLTPAYLVALRYRLAQHLAWLEAGGEDDPDTDTALGDCHCDPTDLEYR